MTVRNSRVTTVLLARRAAALKRHLAAAAAGEGKGIHQARVASRRLREAVPVLAAGLNGAKAGKARRKVRRLTKALGGIREQHVSVALVDELARRETLPRLALEQVRAHVLSERQSRQAVLTKRLEQAKLAKLDRRLDSLREALGAADGDRWREALGTRLVRRAKRLEDAVQHAGKMYEPERLHRVRLAVKKLRYALELAKDTGIAAAAQPVRILKRAQDQLGRLHDLQVLQSHVAAVQADPPTATVPDAGFEIVARSVEDECRHLHAQYLGMAPALGSAIESARTSVVPQLVQPRGRKARALKMDLVSGRRTPKGRRLLHAANQRS